MAPSTESGDGTDRVHLRPADWLKDNAACLALEKLCVQDGWIPMSFEYVDSFFKRGSSFGVARYLVATNGAGAVVGVCGGGVKSFGLPQCESPRSVVLMSLRVHPDYRGRGIAKRLIRGLEDWARTEHGAVCAHAWIARSNKASSASFRSSSFAFCRALLGLGIPLSEATFPPRPSTVPPTVPATVRQLPPTEAVDSLSAQFASHVGALSRTDLESLVASPLFGGTFVAFRRGGPAGGTPSSATVSLWESDQVIKLEIAPPLWLDGPAKGLDLLAGWLPSKFPRIPWIWDRRLTHRTLFAPAWEGPEGLECFTDLVAHIHNAILHSEHPVSLLILMGAVAESPEHDFLGKAAGILPHWSLFGYHGELWIKSLAQDPSRGHPSSWSGPLFLDPRED